MTEPEEQKTDAELMAERSDAWKSARAMLRGSDLQNYTADDVITLARFLMDELVDDET